MTALTFFLFFTRPFHPRLLALPHENFTHLRVKCTYYSTYLSPFARTCFHAGCLLVKYRRGNEISCKFAELLLPEVVSKMLNLIAGTHLKC